MKPWQVPHPELKHHACPLGEGRWRGPTTEDPSSLERLKSLGIDQALALPDGSSSWRVSPGASLSTTEDSFDLNHSDGRAYWIAARIRAAQTSHRAACPRPSWMGILNLTQDSFSDGGDLADLTVLAKRAQSMIEGGATYLDLGAESTRPGAEEIAAEEQLRQLLPALEVVLPMNAQISIDTRNPVVAKACLEHGADMLNDVSALETTGMAETAAQFDCEVVLMHMRGTPQTMAEHTHYDFLLGEVVDELAACRTRALAQGVDPSNILLDPGIGFAKTAEQSMTLLGQTHALRALGHRVLVGPSRKSFLVEALGAKPPKERDSGSAGVAALCASQGASVLRMHAAESFWDGAVAAWAIQQTTIQNQPLQVHGGFQE
ncbi:MAG: dihydropteroate synthase [Planctomycetes bacterium]|nr:dihydropteroate synthase [Planctomycetota bacterium]